MTEHIHTCNYFCDRPSCIKAQRDELRGMFEAMPRALELLTEVWHGAKPLHPDLDAKIDAFLKEFEK